MDIPRESAARARWIRRAAYLLIALAAAVAITVGISRLRPAAPSVERATIWIDLVKRGAMIRQVRGLGALVPEQVRWIPATTEGRIERVLVKPGAQVKPDTVIIEMSNPELEQDALDAQMQLKAAEAAYASLQVRLESQLLDQQAQMARVLAEYDQAKLRAESDKELAKKGLVAELQQKLSEITADELSNRYKIEQRRLQISSEAVKAQLTEQKAIVEQRRALLELRRKQIESLRVRAGVEGVLQEVSVEVGKQIRAGENLARVVNPLQLKAEVRVPETQARDLQLGQRASVDTRNGIIPGRVAGIDPAAQNGTVRVDIALEGPLPKGARPDLSVEGTIELERIENTLYVARPVHGRENGLASLFKLVEGGRAAVRVQVRFGRSSVNAIEIIEGLREGDQVILSDMSAWDRFDRIRLN